MINLYEYQKDYIESIRSSFINGKKRVILCAPTGSGKTVIFSYITKQTIERHKRILILTDRKELFSQSSGSLIRMNLEPSEIKPNLKVDFSKNLYISMVQTFMRRINKPEYRDLLYSMDLIIIDEAHKSIFDKLFDYISNNTYVIGATATPYRYGKQYTLEKFYDDIIQVIDTPELILKNKLSNCVSYGVKVDLTGIKTKGGDYDEKTMGEKFSEIKLFHGVYENYIRICKGKKAILFAPNVESSKELVNDWILKGLNIKHVDCYMTDIERKSIIEWFTNTKGAIISNYGILTTGFDVPDIEVVILYRATKSLPLFLQMSGRGSRISKDKKRFYILDFGNNIKRHNYWEHPRKWTLKKKESKQGEAGIKECPKCAYLMYSSIMDCPECGYKFKKLAKEKESQIITDLVLMPGFEIQKLAEKSSIKDLILIQQSKGYSKSWIYHYLKSKDDFIQYGKLMGYNYKWALRQINFRKIC